jgi:hypothetical protein
MTILDTYAIIPTTALTEELIAQVRQGSIDSVRTSTDGNSAIVSWIGDTPSKLVAYTFIYTHAEMLQIVNDKNGIWWIAPTPPPQIP